MLSYRTDGAPLLPPIELKAHASDVIVKLLKAFLTVAWSKTLFSQRSLLIADSLFADHALPPSVSIKIPWDTLDTAGKPYFSAVCIPNGIKTVNPDKMSVPECRLLYNHILLLQNTPDAFAFRFTDATDTHSPQDGRSQDEQMTGDAGNASGCPGTQNGPKKCAAEDKEVHDMTPAKKKKSM